MNNPWNHPATVTLWNLLGIFVAAIVVRLGWELGHVIWKLL